MGIWIVVFGVLSSLIVVYLMSPYDVQYHLSSSVDRTTIAPRLLLLTELALWVLVAAETQATSRKQT